ncbi:MAG: ribonuclease HI family protein [Candidatus Bipolaricaulota bacterium]
MSKPANTLNIYTDGASRGNPGDGAWAYIILDNEGELVAEQAGYIGHTTNNRAEYFAVIRSLQRAKELSPERVHVHSDSQLLVNQVSGNWKVKDEELRRLYSRIKSLEDNFSTVEFSHHPRENTHISKADALCNQCLDEIQQN